MNNLSISVMTTLAPTKLPLTQIWADPESFLNLVTGAAPANAKPVAATPTMADPLVQNAAIKTAAEPKLLEGPAYSFANASVGVSTSNTPTNQTVKSEISNILASLPGIAIVDVGEKEGGTDITPPVVETLATVPLALPVIPTTNRQFFASRGDNKTNVAAAPDKFGTQFIAPMELPPKIASFQFPELINWTSAASPNPLTATQSDIAPQLGPTAALDLEHDNLWIDQLAKEIVAFASNDGKLRFSLSPPALGDLDVAIQTEGDGVNIQLQPSTESAARIFAAEQPKLVEELRQSGVRLNNSDLLSGHQGHGQREHAHTQQLARQLTDQSSANTHRQTQANTPSPGRRNGKFA